MGFNEVTNPIVGKEKTMGRILDEDVVLKEIGRWIGYLDEDMLERIKTGIKKLPEAQQWIQGKPKKDGEYLISGTGHFVPDHVDEPDTVNGVVGIALYSAKWGWLDHKIDPIEAYMPRPEPWRGEGHE